MPDFMHTALTSFAAGSTAKLLLAAVLGGIIGLEREIKHRPAGLRTNLFICVGAALFTLLSDELAVEHIGDHTRIAAQIIPGIGFIGAGSILHNRGNLITGLTSAATLFMVASIGMAVGGGLYMTACFATGLILLCLFALGHIERQFNLKLLLHSYEITGQSSDIMTTEVNGILERVHSMAQNVQIAATRQHIRMQFDVEATRKEQLQVLDGLRHSTIFSGVVPLGPVEAE